jgi:hypothetical protein
MAGGHEEVATVSRTLEGELLLVGMESSAQRISIPIVDQTVSHPNVIIVQLVK